MRAEQILATPVSRLRFAGSHLVVADVGSLVILLLVGAAFGITDAAVTGDAAAIRTSVAGALVYTPAVWLVIGIAAALIGVAPRASALSWAFLGLSFVIGMFGQLLNLPAWVLNVSPFQHVPHYPAADLRAPPLVWLLAIAAGLVAIGLAGLRHRDIA